MKIEHRGWTVESAPRQIDQHWHAWAEVERRPHDDVDGHTFHFTDIGHYDSQQQALERGIVWAVAWLDSNY
jgi:hypothetical protein